jgi:hypothetical protein
MFYEGFAKDYPGSEWAPEARKRAEELREKEALAAYKQITNRKEVLLDRFIREHPNTGAAMLAEAEIAGINMREWGAKRFLDSYHFRRRVPEDSLIRDVYYREFHSVILRALGEVNLFEYWKRYLTAYPGSPYWDQCARAAERLIESNAGEWVGWEMLCGYLSLYEKREQPCPSKDRLLRLVEGSLCNRVMASKVFADYQLFKETFPNSSRIDEIKKQETQLRGDFRAFRGAADTHSIEALQSFIKGNPENSYITEAREKLAARQLAKMENEILKSRAEAMTPEERADDLRAGQLRAIQELYDSQTEEIEKMQRKLRADYEQEIARLDRLIRSERNSYNRSTYVIAHASATKGLNEAMINLVGMKRRIWEEMNEAKLKLTRSLPAKADNVAPRYAPTRASRAEEHWIEEQINDGQYLLFEDGSLWEISPLDRIETTLWLPLDDIVVVGGDDPGYPYLLINTTDSEAVNAQRIRGDRHWIEETVDDGQYLMFEDRSLWEISPLDRIVTILWLAMTDIIVVEGDDPIYPYLLINTDDGEAADARPARAY